MSAPLLEVRDLHVRFAPRGGWFAAARPALHAIRDVTFDLNPGETLGLVGESGSGKSTIARAILRLVPAQGHVRLGDADVLAASGRALRALRRRMQMVFQDPGGSLNPRARVRDIVAEPLIVHAVGGDRRERARMVAELLERCGLPADAADRYPHQFSGGQKQRIAIARAIALSPSLIICDEPTSALDVSIQAQILALLKQLQREHAIAYLFISHDMGVIRSICHRVAVLRQGAIVEQGPRDQVLDAPRHEYTRTLLASVPRLIVEPHHAHHVPSEPPA